MSYFTLLAEIAAKETTAVKDIKYFSGEQYPFRNGMTDEPITDPVEIEAEEAQRAAAEAEDESVGWDAESMRARGVRVDWLVALTFNLNLWEWPTWKVVEFLVKPATETHGRCRFADLPLVKAFTGPADVFITHCWGGRWGDLVVSVASGARCNRIVWLDVFAARN